jgi:protein tyrosine/serine phosphatase
METLSRLLPLIGSYNFRDLGGYPTLDGRITRWGQLYRSDTLAELTDADVDVLREIGLKSIIDLRTDAELLRTGRGLLGSEPVRHVHLPVVQETGPTQGAPPEAQADLFHRYLWYLDVGRDNLVTALTMVGDPQSYPMVFHCAAGKDRTGVLAALVLEIVGVERNSIVEDYVLTASRMDLILSRIKKSPQAEARIAETPQFLFRAEAATMESFLDELHETHGGAREWALASGVSLESVEAMPELLVRSHDDPEAEEIAEEIWEDEGGATESGPQEAPVRSE